MESRRGRGKVTGLQQEDYQELRLRKIEELRNLQKRPKDRDGSWNRVLSKQEKLQEKKFQQREARLRNTTSFFVNNLPTSCSRERLWEAFQRFENLEDVFVPRKKDGAGNRFGFLKSLGVTNAGKWMENLKGISIDGALVGINVAKFNRDVSKAQQAGASRPNSVFTRLGVQVPQNQKSGSCDTHLRIAGQGTGQFHYRDALANVYKKGGEKASIQIDLPSMNTDAKKNLELRSLIGEVQELDVLKKLEGFTHEALNTGREIR